ncbi:hypothetical protein CM50_10675 [Bacillus subtilis]|nr:hypothetical protein CM50_10675 [Bacillus subtilis] [Bacillus stercoris]
MNGDIGKKTGKLLYDGIKENVKNANGILQESSSFKRSSHTTLHCSGQAETGLTQNKFVIVITMPIDNSTK